MLTESLTEKLKDKRLDMGLKQGEIGEGLGIDQTTVSLLERNPRRLIPKGADFAISFFAAYKFSEIRARELARELFGEEIQQLYKGFGNVKNPTSDFPVTSNVLVSVSALDKSITEVRQVPKAFLGGYAAADCAYLAVTDKTLADEVMRDMLEAGDDLYVYKGNAPIEGKPAIYECNGLFAIVKFEMQEKESVKSLDGEYLSIIELKNCDLAGRVIGHYRAY